MSLADNIRRRAALLANRVIEVPEWGDESGPGRIWCDPFTLADRARVAAWAGADQSEFAARVIVLKARDEAGNPAFDRADLPLLRGGGPESAEAAVVMRVAAEIMDAGTREGADPIEQAEKN